MTTLYTAVGRFERRTDRSGNSYPVVILSGKEHMMDIHEMLLWTCLVWRVLTLPQLEVLHNKKAREAGITSATETQITLDRLLRRGLTAVGIGDTDGDALHDLLSELYVVPAVGGAFAKAAAFLKLTLLDGLPFHKAKRLFVKEKLSDGEQRIFDLAKQALLSTSELIKCVEVDVYDVSTNEKLMGAIYDDDYTTSDNIGYYAQTFKAWRPALTAVANLYLRQLILFERI
jgi:hypothetical protein